MRPVRARATLLQDLATLLESGLPAREAVNALRQAHPASERPLRKVAAAAGAGRALSGALVRGGMLAPHERAWVEALEACGRVDLALRELGEWVVRDERAWTAVRARLFYPAAVFLLVLLLRPLPALAAGHIGPAGYLVGVGQPLALVGVLVLLFVRGRHALMRVLRRLRAATGALPLTSRWKLYRLLSVLLSAGVPAGRGLAHAVQVVEAPWDRALRRASAEVSAGSPVVAALDTAGCLSDRADRRLLEAAEQGGRLPELFAHRALALDERLSLRRALWREWLPRLAYGLVVVWLLMGFV